MQGLEDTWLKIPDILRETTNDQTRVSFSLHPSPPSVAPPSVSVGNWIRHYFSRLAARVL